LLDSVSKVNKDDHISIHLPDYLEGNRIVDPISIDTQTRNDSRELIKRTGEFAKQISNKIGKHIPIIGSFSQRCDRKREDVLEDLFYYLPQASEYKIYPQWLPAYAWYFGGSVKLDLFNSQEDIEYINNKNIDITLDLCHLSLSAEYSKESWLDWYNQLKDRIGHFHLADAEGVDGEGLDIGSGNIGDFSIFLDSEKIKVIEVWQGHFHDGIGFLKALDTLNKQKQNWDKATKCLN
jgi:N-acetylneuraminate synthase